MNRTEAGIVTTHRIPADVFSRLRRRVEVCCEFPDTHALVQADGFLFGMHAWRLIGPGGRKPGDSLQAECLATGEVCRFVLD